MTYIVDLVGPLIETCFRKTTSLKAFESKPKINDLWSSSRFEEKKSTALLSREVCQALEKAPKKSDKNDTYLTTNEKKERRA